MQQGDVVHMITTTSDKDAEYHVVESGQRSYRVGDVGNVRRATGEPCRLEVIEYEAAVVNRVPVPRWLEIRVEQ
jgi:hypothetical protein